MPMLPKFSSFFRNLLGRGSRDRQLDEELESYVEHLAEKKVRAGLSSQEARRQALIELGGKEPMKEKIRERRIGFGFDTLLQDIRYGLRMLRRNPGFTTVAVLTLALGIGANTAIFTVVNSVLLTPVPFPNPEEIFYLYETSASQPQALWSTSPPNYLDWKSQNSVFQFMSGLRFRTFTITGGVEPERRRGVAVSVDYFSIYRVKPLLGRFFTAEEEQPGRNSVVVLGYGYWQSRFGGDPGIVGQALNLNDRPHTIIGVLPPGLPPALLVPWVASEDRNLSFRTARDLSVMARTREGVSREQAVTEMVTIAQRLAETYPDANEGMSIQLLSLHERTVRFVERALWVLLGAVGFVLLIACANVTNLLLARTTVRERELAVRTALGAGRGRLVRQMLTEGFLLSFLGGGLGLLIAWSGVRVMIPYLPPFFPRSGEIGLQPAALWFVVGVSVLTTLLFSLAPAVLVSARSVTEGLKQGRTGAKAGGRHWLRNGLMIAEVSLAIVLLTGAGLLTRSFVSLVRVDPGFDTTNLLTFKLSLPEGRYPTADVRNGVFRRLRETLDEIPGVETASLVSTRPLGGDAHMSSAWLGTEKIASSDALHPIEYVFADERYFGLLAVSVKKGRGILREDTETAAPVIVLSEALAERYWPAEDPLGKFVFLSYEKEPREVIGIVGSVRYGGLDKKLRPKGYIPYRQAQRTGMGYLLRTSADPRGLIEAVKARVWALDDELPVRNIRTMGQLFSQWLVEPRFYLSLFVIFSSLAGALACAGIYGVISYAVGRRTHEIGVRLALGAHRRDILKLVVGQGMALVAIGIVIGLLASYWLTRFLEKFLFEVEPSDPVTFAAVSVLLSAVALLACFIPARRATKVDPMVALRYE